MAKKKKKKELPVNLAAFRQRILAKVMAVGNYRAAGDEVEIDFTKLNRYVTGKQEMSLPDFFTLLAWVGGKMPEW